MPGHVMLPYSIFVNESICEDGEFSGDSDKCDFGGFSAGCETLVEDPHVGIEASGAEGREIENMG